MLDKIIEDQIWRETVKDLKMEETAFCKDLIQEIIDSKTN
jgi:hypothetical protein